MDRVRCEAEYALKYRMTNRSAMCFGGSRFRRSCLLLGADLSTMSIAGESPSVKFSGESPSTSWLTSSWSK